MEFHYANDLYELAVTAADFRTLFTTPMLVRHLDLATASFLLRLKALILTMEGHDRGITASNSGGWHSRPDLFNTNDPDLRMLAEALLAASADMTYQQIRERYPRCRIKADFHGGSWANVLRDGDANRPHIHPGATWSGTFYVATGDRAAAPPSNGCIEFIDPRPANLYGRSERFDPKPGTLLMFPHWLMHYVNPFRGAGERISIAFNTKVEVLPILGPHSPLAGRPRPA